MKKRVLTAVAALVLVLSLFPIRNQLKDGGTVEFNALLYKVSKVKRLISIEEMEREGKVKEYDHGLTVEILGFEVFNNVQ